MSKPRSLSLAAYRILSWGVAGSTVRPEQPRPTGELLWVHVAAPDRLHAVTDFCMRLQQARPGLSLLITIPLDADTSGWTDERFPLTRLPTEQANATRSFLDHWQPNMGLWVGGGILPNLITRAEERDIPLILIEAKLDVSIARGARWLPDIARYTFDCFQTILTTEAETARQLRHLGISPSKVSQSPPLQISPNPRAWPEDELIEINTALVGRPVWLAAWVQATEFISILTAHRQAMRMLPRLALVLHVADISESAPLHRRLEKMDLRCTNWDESGAIEDTTQVILTSEPEDLGLWHRVSAVTFMGSSLDRDAVGKDPLMSVSLGSAVVHGPFVSRHQDLYDRLKHANAAKSVRTATELGDAVVELLAPDRSAQMALAGWQLITEGAPHADHLIELVQEALDLQSSQDEST